MEILDKTLRENGLLQSQERAADRAWEMIKAMQKEMLQKEKNSPLKSPNSPPSPKSPDSP
jgi:hypothetical protein